jgi:hypothetical protein
VARGDDGSIELVVRDLRTGDADHRAFASEAEACAWLRERPAFVEVLGVSHPIPPGTGGRLHEAMRPLDEDEMESAAEFEEKEAGVAEATEQIRRAVARGFMLENRWAGPRRND